MLLIILSLFLVGSLSAPAQQSMSVNDDGSYQFFYETGEEGGRHSRTEVRQPDGVVVGKYSYEDANGDIREVNYRADDSGYVANGDVSVEGAPKGKFPADPEVPGPDTSSPEEEKPEPEEATSASPQPQEHADSHQDQEPKEDDIRGLSLDEPTVNDPPEAFPPGYFLHQFQGLRRLPDPTTEEPSTTPQPEIKTTSPPNPPPSDTDYHIRSLAVMMPYDGFHKDERAGGHGPSMPLLPFQGPHKVGPSMFRQPVYVFSYHHPDSYRYQYFF